MRGPSGSKWIEGEKKAGEGEKEAEREGGEKRKEEKEERMKREGRGPTRSTVHIGEVDRRRGKAIHS